jgi:dTDP-4-amino-4,6-dideoxygalactose transaminase
MHLQPIYYNQFRGHRFPVAEDLCRSGFYLPTHESLEEADIEWIVQQIADIHGEQMGRSR